MDECRKIGGLERRVAMSKVGIMLWANVVRNQMARQITIGFFLVGYLLKNMVDGEIEAHLVYSFGIGFGPC